MPKLPPLGADVSDLLRGGGSLPPIGAEIDADPINQPTPRQLPARADVRLDDTPGMFGSAGRRELMRTGKEAAIGLARSPLDAVKGLFGMVRHPIDTVTNTASAIAHPIDTWNTLGDDPRAAGSMLGQVLMGRAVPGNVGKIGELGARGVAGAGRAAGAVGRGMEAVGASAPARHLGTWGAVEAAMSMDPKGLLVAAAPTALKYGGKGLQAGGAMLERAPSAMDSLMAGRAGALEQAAAARRPALNRAMGIGREAEQPMRPWSPDAAYAEEAWPAAESVASDIEAPRYRDQTGRSIPTAAELDEEFALGADPVENELVGGRRRMAEERHGIRPMSPPPEDALRRAMLSRQRYEPPSMAALVDEAPTLTEDLADLPGLTRDQFNQRFHQQLMESLSRGR